MFISGFSAPYSHSSYRCIACCLIVTIDSAYNDALTLTPLNFLRVNASSVSLFYGSAPWHYYFTQAFPLLAGPTLPFVLHGAYLIFMHGPQLLLYTVVWTSVVFSCIGHKEWRFLHPLVPIMHLFAARSLLSFYDRSKPRYCTHNRGLAIMRTHVVPLILLSLAPSLYVMRWHSSAQIGVLSYLRGRPDTELRSIGFLMPCHSTPAQSHLHRRIPVWRLSCEPPLQ
jgi:GPI mannosyltransferase 3